MCMYVTYVCSSYRGQKSVRFSGTAATDIFKWPCGCWKPNLEEHPMLLTTRLSLQPGPGVYCSNRKVMNTSALKRVY